MRDFEMRLLGCGSAEASYQATSAAVSPPEGIPHTAPFRPCKPAPT